MNRSSTETENGNEINRSMYSIGHLPSAISSMLTLLPNDCWTFQSNASAVFDILDYLYQQASFVLGYLHSDAIYLPTSLHDRDEPKYMMSNALVVYKVVERVPNTVDFGHGSFFSQILFLHEANDVCALVQSV